MERINQVTLFGDLHFSERKGRNFRKPARLGVDVLFLECTFVCRYEIHFVYLRPINTLYLSILQYI